MRQPECLAPLVDQGIIQEVVRPLMSGKEAQIYLVVSGGELRVAKVYKAAQDRTFRQRAEYTEGRAVRNTRTQRAMSRHSRYGRAQDEASWRSAEVDIIYRLRAAGVRVPEPHYFSDGILVMELITDADGDPAPRLADVALNRVEAGAVFATLLSAVVKMLCVGVVHGDLSDFNVLMGQGGPVLIDFPQAVDAAHNLNARKLLVRDVDNLNQFLVRVAPGQRRLPYGQEMWDLYARSELSPETRLTGRYQPPSRKADTSAVLHEIEVAAREAQRRRDALGPIPGRRGRTSKPHRQAAPAAATTAIPARSAPTTALPTTDAGGGKPGPETKPAPSRPRRRRRRRRATGAGRA
jgi:RIO kinase 1